MHRLWIAFVLVLMVSFTILGWIGSRINAEKPPIPDRVVTTDATVLIDNGQIESGQNVWQSMGGMEVGSIWGHGSYVAPDWSADWLHREATGLLDRWSMREHGRPYAELDAAAQAALRATGSASTRSCDRCSRFRMMRRCWCSPASPPASSAHMNMPRAC